MKEMLPNEERFRVLRLVLLCYKWPVLNHLAE
jgi:hypothetical protein